MQCYINDLSLQGQFPNCDDFEAILRQLITARIRASQLRSGLRTTRTLCDRLVVQTLSLRSVLQKTSDVDLRRAALSWFDRSGPFMEDDRTDEINDYFEYAGLDATETGLGEAGRRIKAGELSSTFSFCGGPINFEISPLNVIHGIPGDRLGDYDVPNHWFITELVNSAFDSQLPINSWKALIERARARFRHLVVADSVFENERLSREPFDAAIRNRTLALMKHLDSYMQGLDEDGAENPASQEIVRTFFHGDRALFSNESLANRREFAAELTFDDPSNTAIRIFAPWHGKISRRHFRMHFEWPVPTNARTLKILYLGPKLTKA